MAADEPLSPELVLVDPELARRARASLGRRELPRYRPEPPAEPPATAAPPPPAKQDDADSQDVEAAPFRPPRNRCVVPSLLSGLLGALIVALAISFKSTPGYYMPPVPSTDSGAATEPPEVTAPTTTGESAPSRGFRVSWKPERDAVGYEVTLSRGSRTLYRAYSLQTSMELPVRWSFRGRAYALDPGVYKWLVWPVRAAGARDAAPSVRKTLVVPGIRP